MLDFSRMILERTASRIKGVGIELSETNVA